MKKKKKLLFLLSSIVSIMIVLVYINRYYFYSYEALKERFLESSSCEMLSILEKRSSWNKTSFDERFFYAFKLSTENRRFPLKMDLEHVIKENPGRSLILSEAILISKELDIGLKYHLAGALVYEYDVWNRFCAESEKNRTMYVDTLKRLFSSGMFTNSNEETYMGYVLMQYGDTTPVQTFIDLLYSYRWNQLATTIEALKFKESNQDIRKSFHDLKRRIRRIEYLLPDEYKKTYSRSGGSWNLTSEKRFVWDKNNIVAELNASDAVQKRYTWHGEELLRVTDNGNQYFPTIDGNKNITAYLDSSDNVVAEYTYSPFGKITVSSGSMKDNFNFRFSSEYLDKETELVYYNFRYYNPALGRWLSRDPIAERGGMNLYVFINNDGINNWDMLGYSKVPPNSNIWVTGIPKTVAAYKAALEAAKASGASAQHIRQLAGGLKVLKRLVSQRGIVNSNSLLRGGGGSAIGLLLAAVVASVADYYGFFSDNEPDWKLTETGPKKCNRGYVRVPVKQVATVKFSHGTNVTFFLLVTHPTYWFEKSLKVTYKCCCEEPKRSEWKKKLINKTGEIKRDYGGFFVAEHTLYYQREIVTGPCHIAQ